MATRSISQFISAYFQIFKLPIKKVERKFQDNPRKISFVKGKLRELQMIRLKLYDSKPE